MTTLVKENSDLSSAIPKLEREKSHSKKVNKDSGNEDIP